MRCVICNEELRDFEATRKDPYTKQFLDTCNQCWKASKVASLDNYELMSEADRAELDEIDEFDIEDLL